MRSIAVVLVLALGFAGGVRADGSDSPAHEGHKGEVVQVDVQGPPVVPAAPEPAPQAASLPPEGSIESGILMGADRRRAPAPKPAKPAVVKAPAAVAVSPTAVTVASGVYAVPMALAAPVIQPAFVAARMPAAAVAMSQYVTAVPASAVYLLR